MRRAAELLLERDSKIETIANRVGYQNLFVSSTTFKRVMGWPNAVKDFYSRKKGKSDSNVPLFGRLRTSSAWGECTTSGAKALLLRKTPKQWHDSVFLNKKSFTALGWPPSEYPGRKSTGSGNFTG